MSAAEEWRRGLLRAKLKGEPYLEPHVAINERLYELSKSVALPAKTGDQILLPGHREKIAVVVNGQVQVRVGDAVTVVRFSGKRAKGKEIARGRVRDLDMKPSWGAWTTTVLVEVESRA